MKLKAVTPKRSVKLDDEHATARSPIKSGKALERATKKQVKRISELQRVLYADGRYALLIVLQGRDASGKDGTIRKVFTAVNPQGCNVASFKVPTELEQRHDFLWRVHAQVPPRSMIGIFNRSHYEDVLVPRVRGSLTKKECFGRYDEINDFEEMLSRNGVVILKFMLHVSRDEQKQRLMERLSDETKNWKFRVGDLEDRAHWDDYTEAYQDALRHTSTKRAPWFIVPADDKDVRDWLVARTIADALDDLDLRYPPADPSVLALHFS
ncbi:MAG: polyphosphate kinase 2 family protein [Gemmatimonadota bacterium]|nr:polyphosphate kinase 2 family protein [Gemmatimonadota bacterium]